MHNILVKSSRSSEQGTGSFYRPKICKQASPHVIRMVVKKCFRKLSRSSVATLP